MASIEEKIAARKNKKKEALWMLSFSDLSLILVCLFALIISISTINTQKFDNITGNFKARKPLEKQEKNLQDIEASLQQKISERHLENSVAVKLNADGLAIEFKDRLLFQSGSSEPNPEYRQVVADVLSIIAEAPKKYSIELEGHTDDIPLNGTGRYRNNWELSSARGYTLLHHLRSKGVHEDRMQIRSFAHTRPKIPLQGLAPEKIVAARAANRRVVIRLN